MHSCPNCFTLMQDDLPACPFCGEVQIVKRKKGKTGRRKQIAVLLVLCLLIAAGTGVFLMVRNRNGGGNAKGIPIASRTNRPTQKPTASPTNRPTQKPTASPTNRPTQKPTASPTNRPTQKPTASPTNTRTPVPYAPEPRTNSKGAYVISSVKDAETVLRYVRQNLPTEFLVEDPSGMLNSYVDIIGASWSSRLKTDGMHCRWTVEWPAGTEAFRAYQSGDPAALTGKSRYILNSANALLQQIIDDGMTDLEKEYAIHDAIVNNCEYEADPSKHTDSAEGFFFYGRCQCSGYADTFYLLCRLAGLDVWMVRGKGGGGPHAWNLVMLDGKWYMVDVTWDDPIGAEQTLRHDFLNVPVSAVRNTHTWDRAQDPLGAFADSFDENHYVKRNGGEAYSEQEAAELLYSLLSATAFKEEAQILYHGQVNDSVCTRITEKMWKLGINGTIWYSLMDKFDSVSVLTYGVE